MRKNKKNLELEKKLENREGTVNPGEIPMYVPHADIIPIHYSVDEGFAVLEREFKQFCMAYFEAARPDMDNGNCLDNFIEMKENQALRGLRKQREEHIRDIMGYLGQMHDGDAALVERKLENHRKQKEAFEKELAKLDKVFHKGTVYENLDGGESV